MYYFAAYLLKGILRLFGKLHVHGKENIHGEGAYVIACTHTGWVDILYLGVSLLPGKVHYMAKKQLFTNKLLGGFLRKLNAFPVDRDNPGPSVLKVPSRLLSKGEVVGIFPSGTRAKEQAALKQGAITIAQRSGVPVIPAAYIGPNGFKELMQNRHAYLIFGEPMQIPAGKEQRDQYTSLLEERMNGLAQRMEEERRKRR